MASVKTQTLTWVGAGDALPNLEIWKQASSYTLWGPPSKIDKTITGLLQPIFEEGTGSFVSGGPSPKSFRNL